MDWVCDYDYFIYENTAPPKWGSVPQKSVMPWEKGFVDLSKIRILDLG